MTPIQAATIGELVDTSAAFHCEGEALVDGDLRLSFPQLREEVQRLARALLASGLEAGERVGLWGPNTWEWAITALGVHCAGGVVVPVNTRFKGAEAAYVLGAARTRLLFTVSDFLDTNYVALLQQAGVPPELTELVLMRGSAVAGSIGFDDFRDRAAAVSQAELERRRAAVSGDDPCHIMFTSGTTGAPKGAVLVHAAVCRAYRSWASLIGLRADDRYLIVNPFFHSFGLNAGILACLMTGATMLPQAVFDVPELMARIPAEGVTTLPGPPAIYQTILAHPELAGFDMSTLRLAVTGAAPVPVELIERMHSQLGFEVVVTGYGLTEASGIVTMCRHDDDPETISRTSGRAIDDVEVRVIAAVATDDNALDADQAAGRAGADHAMAGRAMTDHGSADHAMADHRSRHQATAEPADPVDGAPELRRGEPGEIVVRGYNVMTGYLDDPDRTAATIDTAGWLHTGDIGVMDAGGYITITDRLKDMFISGGFNAYPAEIEHLMLAHPDIEQVAVVGVPDERLGEVGHGFVVITHRSDRQDPPAPLADEIIAWCRARMANYKAPRHIEFVTELPRNASGKVLKYQLRRRALAHHARA